MIVDQEWPLVKHYDHPSIENLSMETSTIPIHDRLTYDSILLSYNPDQSEAWKYVSPIIDLCLLDLRNDWLKWIRTLKPFWILTQPYKDFSQINSIKRPWDITFYEGWRILSWSSHHFHVLHGISNHHHICYRSTIDIKSRWDLCMGQPMHHSDNEHPHIYPSIYIL